MNTKAICLIPAVLFLAQPVLAGTPKISGTYNFSMSQFCQWKPSCS